MPLDTRRTEETPVMSLETDAIRVNRGAKEAVLPYEGGMRADRISNWQIGRQATMIMGVWGFFAVFMVLNIYINAEISEAPHTALHNAIGFPIVQYVMLALSTLPILYFTKYVENTIKSRPVWISAHVGGALLLMAADATGWVLVPAWIRPDLAHSPNLFAKYEKSFVAMIGWNFWVYWTVVGIAYGVQYYHEMRDARVRAAELERELVEAQLQTLKQQLRPHFLFNTLNAISALIHTDTRAADDMIGNLSALLRFSVDSCNVQCVPLKDELSTLQLYLDIQQARFGSRFTVDMRIDPRTLEAYVPHLILQPLVENAFNHGIAKRAAGGRLCIHAESIENNMVRLRVMDNGPGSGGNATHCKGIGLSNTQARLRTLHGKAAKLTIDDSAKGFTVEAVFPFVNVMGKLV